MAYSSINPKTGNCSICGAEGVRIAKVGKLSYCKVGNNCDAKRNRAITKERAAKLADKRKQIEAKKQGTPTYKGSAELQRWFIERRAEMTGECAHCGGKSCRDSDQYFKFSLAHILPKAYFPSVATHPDNWIELCHFGNSCHGNMDNKMLDLIEMDCFSSIVDKFVSMYPSIAANEKRRIPQVLMQYVEVEK